MEKFPILITSLEDLLVKEFRACQTLYSLTKDERQALARNDISVISRVVEEKEALLDEMGRLEEKRRVAVQDVADMLGLNTSSPTITDITISLNPDSANRINYLREGILALTRSVRDLTSGNHALALSALERADAVQAFLLQLYRPSLTYRPPGAPHAEQVSMSLDVDHGA